MADGQPSLAGPEEALIASISAKIAPVAEQAPAEAPPAEETPPEAPVEKNQLVEGADAPVDEPATAEIPLDQLESIALEVKVKGDDGSDVIEKPTIKELREGYMRQKDYSRKTAEVARQREEVGEKVRQAIDGERGSYQQNLQQLQALVIEAVAPELKDVNWNHLAANDAFEYVRLRNRADQIQNVLSTIKSKAQEFTEKQKSEQSETIKKVALQARQKLEDDIPGFDDTLYQNLLKTAPSVGYSTEEAAQWVDPRAIKLLHKAYLYDQLKAGKPTAQNKVVVAPKVVKPGATQNVNKTEVRYTGAMEKLQKSGRIEDAAAAIHAKIFG